MQELEMDVAQIEEWQTIKDLDSLDRLFSKAQQVLTGGGIIIMVRKQATGKPVKFDELTTLDDLQSYKNTVFKYLL
ncbi:MAG TPA: hypothetical protein VEX63_00115 [Flavisolibacter sp.]|nr:hypothetical protein [Flavisolibacter sp.]